MYPILELTTSELGYNTFLFCFYFVLFFCVCVGGVLVTGSLCIVTLTTAYKSPINQTIDKQHSHARLTVRVSTFVTSYILTFKSSNLKYFVDTGNSSQFVIVMIDKKPKQNCRNEFLFQCNLAKFHINSLFCGICPQFLQIEQLELQELFTRPDCAMSPKRVDQVRLFSNRQRNLYLYTQYIFRKL